MRLNTASLCCTQLEMSFHDIELGKASGFIYSLAEHYFLVTNWHVLSGLHPLTNAVMDNRGLQPNRVKFHYALKTSEGRTSIKAVDCGLYDDSGKPLWWSFEGYQTTDLATIRVDIAVLRIDYNKSENAKPLSFAAQLLMGVDDDGNQYATAGYPPVASEVFILGYPLGLTNQGIFPIWKRGSIASEPYFNINDNVPVIYVDATTRAGMSGSPVVYTGSDLRDMQGNASAERDNSDPWLVGVYAGRDGATEAENSIVMGRVWRGELVDGIIMQGLQREYRNEHGSPSLN